MASWCLVKQEADKFLSAIKDGSLDPYKMFDMSPQERHAYIAKVLSEDNATRVNALFEERLGKKARTEAIQSWINKSTTEGTLRNSLTDKLQRIENQVFKPVETGGKDIYLEDLAKTKLGMGVTEDEAKKIFDMSKEAQDLQAKVDRNNKQSLVDYGNKLLDLNEYMDSLVPHHTSLFSKLVNLANLPRSVLTSVFHLSAPFVQGWGMMTTKEFWGGFGNMFKYFASEKAYKDSVAYIVAHPDYQLAKAGGLGLTKLGDKLNLREEAIQSSILEHIPGLKVLVNASGRSFTGFLNYVRFSRFSNLLDAARLNGEDLTKNSQVVKDIANVVNDFTGRGSLGKNDKYGAAAPALNALFFSPRKIAATINMFNPIRYLDPSISPTARQAAFRQLAGSLIATTAIISLAKLSGAQVETNPTSSEFGKIKIGNTTIDITGGNRAYAVLLARLVTGQVKSNSTDITTQLGQGFGAKTRGDILINFFRSKLSPTASAIADWLYQTDKKPFNVSDEVYNKLTPIIVQDILNFAKNDPNNTAAILPSLVGIFGANIQSTNTSQTSSQNANSWSSAPTVEQSAFLQRVGQQKFDQANKQFNQQYNAWLQSATNNPKYQALSDKSKQSTLTAKKANLQREIFKQYGFVYKRTTTSQQKSDHKQVRSLAQ